MVNKSIHRTNQFRIPCPQCTHSILVTEKPQAMFAAFQILSFERSGIADQLHKKHLSPIRPEGTNVPKQKTYRPLAHSNDFAALQRQKSCVSVQHFAPVPLFGRARSTSRYRMPPVLPSVGPEATLRTPDFRLPDKFVHPENKKGCKRMFATQPTTRSFAEREGFEPPVQLPVHRISSAARSTTPASLPVHHQPFGR